GHAAAGPDGLEGNAVLADEEASVSRLRERVAALVRVDAQARERSSRGAAGEPQAGEAGVEPAVRVQQPYAREPAAAERDAHGGGAGVAGIAAGPVEHGCGGV